MKIKLFIPIPSISLEAARDIKFKLELFLKSEYKCDIEHDALGDSKAIALVIIEKGE